MRNVGQSTLNDCCLLSCVITSVFKIRQGHIPSSGTTCIVIEVQQYDQYAIRVDGSRRVTLGNRKFPRKNAPVRLPQPLMTMEVDVCAPRQPALPPALRPSVSQQHTQHTIHTAPLPIVGGGDSNCQRPPVPDALPSPVDDPPVETAVIAAPPASARHPRLPPHPVPDDSPSRQLLHRGALAVVRDSLHGIRTMRCHFHVEF